MTKLHLPSRPPAPGVAPVGEHGFSLIELLVATVILGFTIVALSSALTISLKSSAQGEVYVRAVRYAENVMEELRVEQFLTEGEAEGEFESEPRYRYLTKVEAGELDGLQKVSVEIFYEDESIYQLGTYRFELPVDDTYREYVEETATTGATGGGF